MPPKGLAMLIVGKGKGASSPEGSPEEEASEPPDEAASEGDTGDYDSVAGDILDAVKSDDREALATALQALCGLAQKNPAG
jgi:hypothetical protein